MADLVVLFGLLVLFIVLGMEIPIALGASVAGALLFTSLPLDPVILAQKSVGTMARAWPLLTIPMFIMLGEIFSASGIAKRLIDVANILVGRMPGGLAMVNIVSSFFFGGISGSASADTAAIGGIMIPMMKRVGYSSTFSTVVTITSSTLGPIVPPSVLVILIAWVTDLSVGTLFLAGYLPAFCSMVGMMVVSYVISIRRGYPRQEVPPFLEAVKIVGKAIPALITPFIIIVSVVSGLATVVESAAIALIYSLVIAGFFYRELTWQQLIQVLRNTVRMTAFVGMLLAFASAFAWMVTISGLPRMVADGLVAAGTGQVPFLLLTMVVFLFLGTFLNAGEIVLMTMPVLFPAAVALGLDPIHFATIAALSMVIGNVTPPVGLCLFIGCAISGDRIEDLVRPLMPFVGAMVAVIVILILVPDIVLWVPERFGYVPK